MRIKTVFLLSFLLNITSAVSQTSQRVMDSLYREIELLIGVTWFLEESINGFQVTYCKSCNESYINYLNITDFFSRTLARKDFFKEELMDSISYYSTVSNSPVSQKWTKQERIDHFSELYKTTDVLRFNVRFEKKWSNEKLDSILLKNNQLKDSILKEPLYKSNMKFFSDYRFWIPDDNWRRRTQNLNFYFERLPYESLILEESIFILHNKPFFFAEPMLVDKNDPEYFYKGENRLESERRRTLKIIALCLGIHNYVIVN